MPPARPPRDGDPVDPESPTAPGRRPADERPRDHGPAELAVGARVDHYVMEALRGGGGFATVYRARDERTGQPVALKVLHSFLARTPSILRRFQLEAETIARLDHPEIVRLVGYGELAGGVPYLAMEWIEGATLAELLRQQGPLAVEDVLPIVEALGGALTAAHALGIVHRDLKVANVALADRRATRSRGAPAPGDRLKLFDFGVAKLLEGDGPSQGLTTAGTRIGTPPYMAPEQLLGREIDHRADIYALGILIFELLTGRRPFDGPSFAEIEERHLREPPPAASTLAPVSPAIDVVIQRAMAKDPADRPQSAARVVDELRAAIAGGAPTTRRAAQRRRAVALYVAAEVRHEDVADEVLDQLDAVLARARTSAGAAGLELVNDSGNALLLVGRATGELTAQLAAAESLARELIATVHHSELVVAATVHLAEVECHDGPRYVGGPLLDVPTWIRSEPGVHVTPAARRG
jgi:eukaryotic-like serine/threonine-protein kinase